MKALPKRFYGDPADVVDEMRRIAAAAKRKAERTRIHKSLRIKALVAEVMRKGGCRGSR